MADRMTEEMLVAIEKREKAATPGPWEVNGVERTLYRDAIVNRESSMWMGNTLDCSEFIAHTRSDVPALTAEVRALMGERDAALALAEKLREALDAVRDKIIKSSLDLSGDINEALAAYDSRSKS